MLTEQNASPRLDTNDVNAMSTTKAVFYHTHLNYTMTIEDNQVTENQEGNVISGRIYI